MKPNCYECNYRKTVPGDAHSKCVHPKVKKIADDPLTNIMGMLAGVGRVSPIIVGAKELNIRANPHGIKMGWFNFPINFDPVWLENCDGFIKKELL